MDALSTPVSPLLLGMNLEVLPSLQSGKDSRALDAVAKGFESMFLSILLKEMRQTLEPDTMFPQDSGDILGGLFDLFLGQHLAQAGALGIGAMVKKQLAARYNHDGTAAR
ncbi:MAG TPA: rod-binding protein [Gemmataceae bacterium]|nr:rod-binding protein [Gemmataceae bacterium]